MSISRVRKSKFNWRVFQWLSVLVVAFGVSGVLGQSVGAAWQNPLCDPNVNPDSCNAAAPLNVSAASQTKNGPLAITVNTGTNALVINSGPTGSPVGLTVNSSGGGSGINVVNTASGGALNATSSGATTAASIMQNQSGGTGLNVTVAGSTGGTAISAQSTTSTSGVGVNGVGSDAGVKGLGSGTVGTGVEGVGVGSGNGVEGLVSTSGTGSGGYFDGSNSGKALTTVNGTVSLTGSIASDPLLGVNATLGGSTGGSGITVLNQGTANAAILAFSLNNYGINGTTTSYNSGGVVGCYNVSTHCAVLGSGVYAGYFNGPALVEETLQVNSISSADTLQELQVQGQYADNNFSQFAIATIISPSAMESSGDYLWICNRGLPYTLQQVRPNDGHIVASLVLPANFVCSDLVYDGQYIWATSDGAATGVVRVDTGTHAINFYGIPAQLEGITFDGTNLWATGFSNNTIYKINRNTGVVVNSYPSLPNSAPYGILHVGDFIWWVNSNPIAGEYMLSKIKTDGTGLQHFQISALAPQRLAYDGDEIWVPSTILNSSSQAPLTGFDLASQAEERVVALTEATRDIVFDQNFLWVSAPNSRHLLLVRPLDGVVVNTISAASPSGTGKLERIFFDGHAVWYSMSTDSQIGRYLMPWDNGYADGTLFTGLTLFDAGTNTYTCVQSDGAGGIKSVAGLCP